MIPNEEKTMYVEEALKELQIELWRLLIQSNHLAFNRVNV